MLPILRHHTGPLTRELLLTPGKFGLGHVPARSQPDAVTRMICGFCSTGCSLDIHLRGGQAIGLSPTADYSVNLGMACPKGWEALTVLKSADRATTPLLRGNHGRLEPVNWEVALQTFCQRMRDIQRRHGPDSIAFLSTGQIPTEEMALLGALAKFGMGMLHGDGNTRQCMATSVVAYKQAFGFDAPPYTYQDLEESDVIVLVGTNLCIAHPILWERVLRNRNRPEIIVVDPRRTETAMNATQHLALAPKSDLDLFYGLANILIERGWIDRAYIDAHTTGFDEFAAFVRTFTLDAVASRTGLAAETIQRVAETIHAGKSVSFWWTMGVNQSHQAVRTAQSLINLALMTGNIGRPGAGANSITGQCNAMGSRLFSNTTNLLGGRDFANEEHRCQVASVLELPVERIPSANSWPYHEILEGVLRGQIKGLWIVATNTAHSWINQHYARDVLSRLEFLVVQDMYHTTETAQLAHLVLPAAGWGEKEGTFINSERRIGTIKKVAKAPGKALADFYIFKLIAKLWGCGELFEQWSSPEAVFQILKQLSAGQPCDITGIRDYRQLDDCGGIQWPFAAPPLNSGGARGGSSPPEQGAGSFSSFSPPVFRGGRGGSSPVPHELHQRRLFSDGRFFHADGRARFLFESPRPMPELPNDAYPLLLLTGRGSAAQWHTQTRTMKSAVLRKLHGRSNYVEIHPHDARACGVAPDTWVYVQSQRGQIRAKALVTPTVAPGQVFVPMHDAATNQLTHAIFDPYSKQPAYKACAVRVRPCGTT